MVQVSERSPAGFSPAPHVVEPESPAFFYRTRQYRLVAFRIGHRDPATEPSGTTIAASKDGTSTLNENTSGPLLALTSWISSWMLS